MLGMNLRRSAIYAKLHAEGVHSVELTEPAEDLVLSRDGRLPDRRCGHFPRL